MTGYAIKTARGYALLDVASALQKAIRRGDGRLAGYWAIELWESNCQDYLWRRLLTISAEDCWGILTQEIVALHTAWKEIAARKGRAAGRVFAAKATILLAEAKKSRDADHLTNLVYDRFGISDTDLERDLDAARGEVVEIPEYAYDCHTARGRRAGRTKGEFFQAEHAALKPRHRGLFDGDVKRMSDPDAGAGPGRTTGGQPTQ